MLTKKKTKFGLTNNQLKIIAMVCMLFDHLGEGLFPHCLPLRIIGRLALPIFAYMIAEGCRYTKNRVRHLGLIAALGIGCQVVYWLAMESLYQSILITFTLSIILIYSIDGLLRHKSVWKVLASVFGLIFVCVVAIVLPRTYEKQGFYIDYDIYGVLMPVAVYYAKGKMGKLIALGLMIGSTIFALGTLQAYAFLALPILYLYDGTRGRVKMKYLFYVFYPTHLVVIYFLQLLQAAGKI